jgi:hypothetical protein
LRRSQEKHVVVLKPRRSEVDYDRTLFPTAGPALLEVTADMVPLVPFDAFGPAQKPTPEGGLQILELAMAQVALLCCPESDVFGAPQKSH